MSRFACPAWAIAPVNAPMISAVLAFADIHRDLGAGRTLMRISPELAARADVILLLGRSAERVVDLGVVWNDREDQIIRIVDDAERHEGRLAAWEDAFDLFRSETNDTPVERLVA